MTRLDVTALSGDPMCEMSEHEWANDMKSRLESSTPAQQRAIYRDMTNDEADMVVAAYERQEGAQA